LVAQAEGFAIPIGAVAGLAQVEEPGLRGGAARGGGGLGAMTGKNWIIRVRY